MQNIVAALADRIQPIGDAFDPASGQDLAAAEGALGIRFPVLLRDLQTTYGRFMFNGEALLQVEGSSPLGVFTIFGCKGDKGNIVVDVQAHPDYLGAGIIPIADDMFNNRYVLDLEHGSVLFIDYVNQHAPRAVASSLDEFFRKIEVIPD